MCFNLGSKAKKAKKGDKKRSDGEEESKGLLAMEIEKWKKQQEMVALENNAKAT